MSAQAIIDSLEFARTEQELQGNLPISDLARLQDCLYDSVGNLEFVMSGGRNNQGRLILSLSIKGLVHLRCQRCLGKMDYSLGLSNTLLLASPGEKLVDAVADPDALDYIEAGNELNVAGLIEDEILLCLPFSPRHAEGECPGLEDVTQNARRDNDVHAFAKLEELKKVLESKR